MLEPWHDGLVILDGSSLAPVGSLVEQSGLVEAIEELAGREGLQDSAETCSQAGANAPAAGEGTVAAGGTAEEAAERIRVLEAEVQLWKQNYVELCTVAQASAARQPG